MRNQHPPWPHCSPEPAQNGRIPAVHPPAQPTQGQLPSTQAPATAPQPAVLRAHQQQPRISAGLPIQAELPHPERLSNVGHSNRARNERQQPQVDLLHSYLLPGSSLCVPEGHVFKSAVLSDGHASNATPPERIPHAAREDSSRLAPVLQLQQIWRMGESRMCTVNTKLSRTSHTGRGQFCRFALKAELISTVIFMAEQALAWLQATTGFGRELTRWVPASDDPPPLPPQAACLAAPEHKHSCGVWNQFQENERFGVFGTGFDESLYTTPLDHNRSKFSVEEATAIATEIEQSARAAAHNLEVQGDEMPEEVEDVSPAHHALVPIVAAAFQHDLAACFAGLCVTTKSCRPIALPTVVHIALADVQ